jgi:hypothetical protein
LVRFVHNDADVVRLGLGIMYPGVRQNRGHAMKARKLLEDAALGPDQLAVQAFDEAWEVLKPHYSSDPQSTEAGRLRLANAVLSACRDGVVGADALKERALRSMQAWS